MSLTASEELYIQRLRELRDACDAAINCVEEHGANGLAAFDNLTRLYKDADNAAERVSWIASRITPPKTHSIRLTRHNGSIALHQKRKGKPVCIGCTNPVGVYTREGQLLGVTKLVGVQLKRMREGEHLAIQMRPFFRSRLASTYQIHRIDGISITLGDEI